MINLKDITAEAVATPDVVGLLSVVSGSVASANEALVAKDSLPGLKANFELSNSVEDRKKLDDASTLAATLDIRAKSMKDNLTNLKDAAALATYRLLAIRSDEPLMDALRLGYVPSWSVSGGSSKPYELVEDEALIGLRKFEEATKVAMAHHGWFSGIERFSERLACYSAGEVRDAKAPAELDGYELPKEAKIVDLGKVPTSINDVVKMLQLVIDRIIFVADADGKNTVKAIRMDAKRLMLVFNRDGKGQKIVCGKPSHVEKLVTKALHRIVNDDTYDVDYGKK